MVMETKEKEERLTSMTPFRIISGLKSLNYPSIFTDFWPNFGFFKSEWGFAATFATIPGVTELLWKDPTFFGAKKEDTQLSQRQLPARSA